MKRRFGRYPRAGALAKAGCATVLALGVANCSGDVARNGRSLDSKYGVAASPRVVPDGEPIPKGGGRAMVGQPYVVGGRTYVPTSGKGYDREGWASWYGTAFHGRLTANGEVFDRESVAAASPTLPLPSYVRVTNIVNKRSMIVRVNDRGPYEGGRLIDLSERAAVALDFHRKGTSRVRVEYLGKASTNGSDDAKLLATLTTDGRPAPFGRTGAAVMFADLRTGGERPAPKPAAEPRRIQLADAGDDLDGVAGTGRALERPDSTAAEQPPARQATRQPAPMPSAGSGDDPADLPVPPVRPTGAGLASGADPAPALRGELAPPAVLLPPRRPVLAGIY